MSWPLVVTTDPQRETVSLSEFKDALGISHDEDNAVLRRAVRAARRYLETVLGRTFITTVYTKKIQTLPLLLNLPNPPALTVDSIKYYDTDGAQQTVASSVYTLVKDTDAPYITLDADQSWPSGARSVPRKPEVEIQYQAGYGADPTQVPDEIRQAVILVARDYYELPDMQVSRDINRAVSSLIAPFDTVEFLDG